jgi:hypothetical protein
MYHFTKRAMAGSLAVVILSALLVACGRQPNEAPAAAAVKDVTKAEAAVHLILTVPEGAEAPKDLLHTTTVQPGGGMSVETPWVRSIKRDAPSGFSNLSSVGFADEASLDAWRTAHTSRLSSPVTQKRARVLAKSDSVATGSALSMFKISYYSLVAPVAEFESWVDGYLAKYLHAQRSAGILSSYVMYLEEGAQGRALLVLEYPDASTEQSAEPTKEKLSEQLAASDAEYAGQMAKKEALRTTQSWTLAVPMARDGG